MIGHEKENVVRTFDLKGSLLGRMTKVDLQSMQLGTGLTTLKDKNFLMINKIERIFDVDNLARKDMLEQMERDTEFLR